MKYFPSLINYIEAVSTLNGRTRNLPELYPMLDDCGMPIYRTKGGMLFFPVRDSSGNGFKLGFFLNNAVYAKFSIKPNQKLLLDEFYVHTSGAAYYVDVVLSSEDFSEISRTPAQESDTISERRMSEGLMAFKDSQTGLWGFYNYNKEIAIEPQWQMVDDFAEGRAIVQRNDLFGLIDTKGEVVVPVTFDELSWDGSQYAYGEISGEWGVVDRNGKTILAMKWEWIGEFSNNYFIIQRNQLFGYADKNGNVVIEPIYHDAGSFNRYGAAWVRLDDKEFFIDPQQRRV